jgi:hypothetical protein
LIRHYWVVFKLLITVVATFILLMCMQTLSFIAAVAADSTDVGNARYPSPALHAGGALVVLLVATIWPCTSPAAGRRTAGGSKKVRVSLPSGTARQPRAGSAGSSRHRPVSQSEGPSGRGHKHRVLPREVPLDGAVAGQDQNRWGLTRA